MFQFCFSSCHLYFPCHLYLSVHIVTAIYTFQCILSQPSISFSAYCHSHLYLSVHIVTAIYTSQCILSQSSIPFSAYCHSPNHNECTEHILAWIQLIIWLHLWVVRGKTIDQIKAGMCCSQSSRRYNLSDISWNLRHNLWHSVANWK